MRKSYTNTKTGTRFLFISKVTVRQKHYSVCQ